MFDETKPLYRFYDEVINQKKFEVLDELYAPGYVNHIAPFGLDNSVERVKSWRRSRPLRFPIGISRSITSSNTATNAS
ncbi:MAG: hypothetical protein WBV18_09955 [Methyloceanibacter sp.]|jgi:hypothetical protein|uniref:hypothetical protein n=1 Tax=Methyloceanibacter sp. TaxID=1965321 RepID=UPI003C5A1257